MTPAKGERGVIIPHEKLSSQALRGLIEEVVTRDGTDNGYIQATLEQNIARVANMVLSTFKGETRSIMGTACDKLKPKRDSGCNAVIAREPTPPCSTKPCS